MLLLIVIPTAQAAEIQCPDRWAPTGWVQQGTAPGAKIITAGIIVGPIGGGGELRGDERKTKGGYDVHFVRLNDYAYPLSKWVYCDYGRDARLLRQLPGDIGECVAKVRKKTGLAKMQCR